MSCGEAGTRTNATLEKTGIDHNAQVSYETSNALLKISQNSDSHLAALPRFR